MASHLIAVRRTERFARENHGVIPRSIALLHGIDEDAIHRMVRCGRWIKLQPRAYAAAGAPITWRTHLAAIDASLESKGYALSHRTAGALMGLDGVPAGHVEIVTMGTPKLLDVVVHRVREPWTNSVHIDGFPVTSCHRTALDLFAVLAAREAELAMEDALRKRLTTIDRLWDEYVRTCKSGRNGCKSFRAAVLRRDHRDGTLESRMEARLWRAVRGLPTPAPTPQFRVEARGKNYRIDFAFPEIKLGIEAMSVRWHKDEVRSFYDVKRHRLLTLEGWTMAYYSWDDLLQPQNVRDEIAELRSTLARRLL